MSWRPSAVTTAVVPIAIGLVGNLATNTVAVEAAWWKPVVWTTVGLLIAVAVAVEIRRQRAGGDVLTGEDLRKEAKDLAVVVRNYWVDEANRRKLNDPFPLPVRWRPAPADLVASWPDLARLATAGAGWPLPRAERPWANSAEELAGTVGDLATVWEKIPTGRLVLLGEAGTGKTMLLVKLVLDLLARERHGPAVPVLVSVASWDPTRQDLYSWFAERVALDQPALARKVSVAGGTHPVTLARALLDHDLIMMILDGLDEIPEHLRNAAVVGINERIHAGQPLIVSSRVQAYRKAVRSASGFDVTLTGGAGIQLCQLEPEQVLEYLLSCAGGPAGKQRWDGVADALRGTAPSPLKEVMTTPLMATLARIMYNPRAQEPPTSLPHPNELLSLPDRVSIERHLFDGFVPAAYRPGPARATPWPVEKAQAWLGYLANHLERDHHGAPDLAWWRLHVRATPARISRTVVLLTGCAVALVAGLAAAFLYAFAYGPYAGIIVGPNVAVTTGLIYGIVYWLTDRFSAALTTALISAIAGGLAVDLGGDLTDGGPATLDLLLAAGLAAGLAYPLKVGSPVGVRAGLWTVAAALPMYGLAGYVTVSLSEGLAGRVIYKLADALLVGIQGSVIAGLLVGLFTRLARGTGDAGRDGRRRWLANPMLSGAAAGILIGAAVGFTEGLRYELIRACLLGMQSGVAAALAVGLVTRLAAGPAPVARTDRRRWLANPLLNGALAGLLMGLASVYVASLRSGLADATNTGVRNALDVALAVGLVTRLARGSTGASRLGRWRWTANPVWAGAAAGVPMGVAAGFVQWLIWSPYYGLGDALIVILTYTLLYGLVIGASVKMIATPAAFRRDWTSRSVVGIGYGLFYTLLYGPEYGFAAGLTVALAVELASRLAKSRNPAQRLRLTSRGLILGVLTGAIVGLVMGNRYSPLTGLVIGLTIACATGIIYGIDAPQDISTIRPPERVLAMDRATFTILTATVGSAVSIAIGLTSGMGRTFDTVTGVYGGLTYGVATGLLVAAGQTAWPAYILARFKIFMTKSIPRPWPLMPFLTDAQLGRGVLRQNGATHQFRHLDLQHRLAATYSTGRGPHPAATERALSTSMTSSRSA